MIAQSYSSIIEGLQGVISFTDSAEQNLTQAHQTFQRDHTCVPLHEMTQQLQTQHGLIQNHTDTFTLADLDQRLPDYTQVVSNAEQMFPQLDAALHGDLKALGVGVKGTGDQLYSDKDGIEQNCDALDKATITFEMSFRAASQAVSSCLDDLDSLIGSLESAMTGACQVVDTAADTLVQVITAAASHNDVALETLHTFVAQNHSTEITSHCDRVQQTMEGHYRDLSGAGASIANKMALEFGDIFHAVAGTVHDHIPNMGQIIESVVENAVRNLATEVATSIVVMEIGVAFTSAISYYLPALILAKDALAIINMLFDAIDGLLHAIESLLDELGVVGDAIKVLSAPIWAPISLIGSIVGGIFG